MYTKKESKSNNNVTVNTTETLKFLENYLYDNTRFWVIVEVSKLLSMIKRQSLWWLSMELQMQLPSEMIPKTSTTV